MTGCIFLQWVWLFLWLLPVTKEFVYGWSSVILKKQYQKLSKTEYIGRIHELLG
jgi:hypothetical protein